MLSANANYKYFLVSQLACSIVWVRNTAPSAYQKSFCSKKLLRHLLPHFGGIVSSDPLARRARTSPRWMIWRRIMPRPSSYWWRTDQSSGSASARMCLAPQVRYTHKTSSDITSSYKTSSYKTSSYKTSIYPTSSYRMSRIQNVQDTKRPVTDTTSPVRNQWKCPVYFRQILLPAKMLIYGKKYSCRNVVYF